MDARVSVVCLVIAMACMCVQCQSAPVHPRLEINTLMRNSKFAQQRTLFLRAVAKLQALPWEDPSSYYQLSTIHGLPYATYDNVESETFKCTPSDTQWCGYCHHHDVAFPPWHRAQMLLYEKKLQEAASKLAAEYKINSSGWNAAATALRLPYWDWASTTVTKLGVPIELTLSQIKVILPNGQPGSIPNPLRSFKFPVETTGLYGSNIQKKQPLYNTAGSITHRYPIPPPSGTDSIAALNATFRAISIGLRAQVYALFSNSGWTCFSNDGASDSCSPLPSLDVPHALVHRTFGGPGGHMNDAAAASWDPVFMFHHCNVDRLLALWQLANPSEWMIPGTSMGTFTEQANSSIDANSPLTPFRKSKSAFYTSSEMKSIKSLGYTYEDLSKYEGDAASVLKKLASAYRPTPNYSGYRWSLIFTNIRAGGSAGSILINVFLGNPQKPNAATSILGNSYFGGSAATFVSTMRVHVRTTIDVTDLLQRRGFAIAQPPKTSNAPEKGPGKAPPGLKLSSFQFAVQSGAGSDLTGKIDLGPVKLGWSYEKNGKVDFGFIPFSE